MDAVESVVMENFATVPLNEEKVKRTNEETSLLSARVGGAASESIQIDSLDIDSQPVSLFDRPIWSNKIVCFTLFVSTALSVAAFYFAFKELMETNNQYSNLCSENESSEDCEILSHKKQALKPIITLNCIKLGLELLSLCIHKVECCRKKYLLPQAATGLILSVRSTMEIKKLSDATLSFNIIAGIVPAAITCLIKKLDKR